jgi:hypothetical protein
VRVLPMLAFAVFICGMLSSSAPPTGLVFACAGVMLVASVLGLVHYDREKRRTRFQIARTDGGYWIH